MSRHHKSSLLILKKVFIIFKITCSLWKNNCMNGYISSKFYQEMKSISMKTRARFKTLIFPILHYNLPLYVIMSFYLGEKICLYISNNIWQNLVAIFVNFFKLLIIFLLRNLFSGFNKFTNEILVWDFPVG